MAKIIPELWAYFCITFGIMQVTMLIMSGQGRKFYTHDGTKRKFSILDLEFAASGKEIVNLIKGIYALPEEDSKKVVAALRGQLLVDFLFMIGAYGSIYLLCEEVSLKLVTPTGIAIFKWLARAQCLPWLCDILENFYLLSRIGPNPKEPSKWEFRIYTVNEWIKWGLSTCGAICAIFSMFYFWVTGIYSADSLPYLGIIIVELIVFQMIGRLLRKNEIMPE